jgi:hypothetical protein
MSEVDYHGGKAAVRRLEGREYPPAPSPIEEPDRPLSSNSHFDFWAS